MKDICKDFPGVRALDGVNFRVKRGEIHALVGENGAGKSTLMKILSGLHPSGTFEGAIFVDGEEKHFSHIKDSEHAGIVVIYQELALVAQLSVGENIYLGNELQKNGIINWEQVSFNSRKYLADVGLKSITPETKVFNLGIGQQQLVEIAKALVKKASILILDEPTAALNEEESTNLLNILRELKSKGVTCIYISHKLEEVMHIADSVTVLRDGKSIQTLGVHEDGGMTEDKMINLMVGRTLTQRYPRLPHNTGEVVLDVRDWTVEHPMISGKTIINNINFQVRKGEILGIAGLMGAGRTELAMSLFGAYGTVLSGEIILNGISISNRNPKDSINHGMCYLSEDRKGNGLVLGMDILANITLASLDKVSGGGLLQTPGIALSTAGIINQFQEIIISNKYVKELRIKTPSINQKVVNLSGGNQQKVSLAKWLLADPIVLILDEPTRGIDVGAKYEIYNIMNELVDNGVCIIMISSELPEILGMCDRIIVMHDGRVTGELKGDEATQEKAMYYATGGR